MGNISFTVKANTPELRLKLQQLITKQIAFAAARAVTATAVVTRDDYVLPEYRRTFQSRNKPFEKGVHAVSAADTNFAKRTGFAIAAITPRDQPKLTGTTAARGTRVPTTDFMKRHVTGGIKTPKAGRTVAIPVNNTANRRKKGGRSAGAVIDSLQPKQLLQKNAFVLGKHGSSSLVIAKRTGRGRKRDIEVMWALKRSANVRKRYNPLPAAKRGVMLHFERLMRRQMVMAIKTARLKV
jgi:hypothetical protein